MSSKTIAILQIGSSIGLVLFWTGFFTIGLAPENPPPGFYVYEHSFPLPDGVLAIALFIAGYGLLKGKPYAKRLSLLCAGALFFLGLVDFSFNIQNGMYQISLLDTVLNAFINLWCLFLGLAIVFSSNKS